jgi:threonine dehydratase
MNFAETHYAEVLKAAERIRPHVRRTATLATDLDPDLRLKAECFQVTGSFKVRGAFNAVLSQMTRDPHPSGVIAVSSGNHAQAVALAARTVGIPALILIPEDANPAKVAATRALGAEVIQEGITFANRERRLHEVMAERGYSLVHPFDDWDVIHGQGTAAAEMLDEMGRQRLAGMTVMAGEAAKTGQLAVTEDECRDVVWTMTDGVLWHRLVNERGWSNERFAEWLGRMWVDLLVRRPA